METPVFQVRDIGCVLKEKLDLQALSVSLDLSRGPFESFGQPSSHAFLGKRKFHPPQDGALFGGLVFPAPNQGRRLLETGL